MGVNFVAYSYNSSLEIRYTQGWIIMTTKELQENLEKIAQQCIKTHSYLHDRKLAIRQLMESYESQQKLLDSMGMNITARHFQRQINNVGEDLHEVLQTQVQNNFEKETIEAAILAISELENLRKQILEKKND